MQGTGASRFMDAAKHTCPGAPCALRALCGRHPQRQRWRKSVCQGQTGGGYTAPPTTNYSYTDIGFAVIWTYRKKGLPFRGELSGDQWSVSID